MTQYRNLPQFVDLWQEDAALEDFLKKTAGCVVDGHGRMGLLLGANGRAEPWVDLRPSPPRGVLDTLFIFLMKCQREMGLE